MFETLGYCLSHGSRFHRGSLATAIGLVVSMWLLNGRIDKLDGKIDDLSGKFDRLTGRVDALETSHTAHVNSGLYAR